MKSYLGWPLDYTRPRGAPGLTAPDSMTWQVFKNVVVMGVGGICAVLLEFADPAIRTGVWEHSSFSRAPHRRLKRTATAAMVGAFAPATAAREVIGRINIMHAGIVGVTPAGEPYTALDPELVNWVSATASWSFINAYDRLVRPVEESCRQRFFSESAPIARLYKVTDPLQTSDHFRQMLEARLPRFEPHPIQAEFLMKMISGEAIPGIPGSLTKALVATALDILPPDVRRRVDLAGMAPASSLQTRIVTWAARLADLTCDPGSPAAQASERYGLPHSFPWKGCAERRRLYTSLL